MKLSRSKSIQSNVVLISVAWRRRKAVRVLAHRQVEQPREIVEREHLLAVDRPDRKAAACVTRDDGVRGSGGLLSRKPDGEDTNRGAQRRHERANCQSGSILIEARGSRWDAGSGGGKRRPEAEERGRASVDPVASAFRRKRAEGHVRPRPQRGGLKDMSWRTRAYAGVG